MKEQAPPTAADDSQQSELARVRRGLEDFTYSISHDLRANLRHVTAYLGLLREEGGAVLDEKSNGYLANASLAARRLGLQIDGLLALSNLDRVELHDTVIDPRVLVQEVRTELAPQMEDRPIEWRVADDFPLIAGDVPLLRQLFRHVLSNAIKFTRKQPQARIEVGWSRAERDDQCMLWVRDNGAGFNPRQLSHLFRVFQRLHSESEFEGQGLGLALSRRIVERHGGEIQGEGEQGAGCIIRFSLPLAPA